MIEDMRDISDDFEGLCQHNIAANTGMNFLDFFTFMTRMSFANLVQLYNIPKGCKMASQATCAAVQHIVLNLKHARKVALKMKSTTLAENSGIVELYSAMSSTYKKLHQQCPHHSIKYELTLKNDVHDFFDMIGLGSQDSNPKDLINLIDTTLNDLGQSYLPILMSSEMELSRRT